MSALRTIAAACVFLGLAAISTCAQAPANASWTVMVYLDGDNDLEEMGILDVNQMELAADHPQVNVLVQFDRNPWYDRSNGNWSTTRRYLISPDDDPLTIRSQLLADLGELNMGDPRTLEDFVIWGAEHYPADRYLVVLWDHGNGWRAASTSPATKAICVDDSDLDRLTTAEVAGAFADIATALGRNVDTVACDACRMGELELAYALGGVAGYYVASEEDVPATGLPYDSVLNALAGPPTLSPANLCRAMVSAYAASYRFGSQGVCPATLSALDLSCMPRVASAVTGLADALAHTAASIPSYGDNLRTWWDLA